MPDRADYISAVERLVPRFLRHWRVRGLPAHDVEDIVQDAMTSVYRALAQGAQVDDLDAYCWRAFLNQVSSYFRQPAQELSGAGGREDDPDDPSAEDLLEQLAPMNDHAPGIVELDCLERVMQIIRDRRPQVAIALELSVLGHVGRSAVMAEALGMTSGSANDFVSRAWKEFRQLHERLCGDHDARAVRPAMGG